jgi:hypothetical protein
MLSALRLTCQLVNHLHFAMWMTVAAIGDALSRYYFVASCFDFQKLNEPWIIEAR